VQRGGSSRITIEKRAGSCGQTGGWFKNGAKFPASKPSTHQCVLTREEMNNTGRLQKGREGVKKVDGEVGG